jgi:hypothetical protein
MNVLRNIDIWPADDEDILDFYDHPKIFISRDLISTYLVYWVTGIHKWLPGLPETRETLWVSQDVYMVTEITEDELSSFKTNKITIRDFFLGDPNKPIYILIWDLMTSTQQAYLAEHRYIDMYVPNQNVYLNREE